MRNILIGLAALLVVAIVAGCGGGGGGSAPTVDPNAHPYSGTWKMIDGNATLAVASDGKASLSTTDDKGRWVTLSGTISTSGALQVSGTDSTGLGVRVWATWVKDHNLLHTDSLNMSFDDSPGTSRSYPDVTFTKV